MNKCRYFVPKARWSPQLEEEVYDSHITVFEHEKEPEPTGILDKDGHEFWRMPESRGIGFVRFAEPEN